MGVKRSPAARREGNVLHDQLILCDGGLADINIWKNWLGRFFTVIRRVLEPTA